MPCAYPLRLVHPETGLWREVACGQCRGCRLRRKAAWIGRLRLEMLDHESARFVTLTYADDPGLLDIEHLQKFMKRYRYHYGDCRYFAVGEYGSKKKRGHWHLIIYGHGPEVVGRWLTNKAWDAGFSYDGICNHKTISYVAGYVLKAGCFDKEYKPVSLMSRKPGIGFPRIQLMAEAAARQGLQGWPTEYRIGTYRFPLCAGGLTAFKLHYLEAGGSSPASMDPEIIDADVRERAWTAKDWGTQRRLSDAVSAASYRENIDEHALKTARGVGVFKPSARRSVTE